MQEIELKFQIPAERRDRLWATLRRGRTTPIRLQAHYFDTADGLLARSAIAVRLRREGERWVQTLKASGRHGAARLEDNVELTGDGEAPPPLDLERHRGSPAHDRLLEVLGADGVLLEVYRTEVLRHIQLLEAGDGLRVELAFDEGWVIAGGAEHRLCEIEFELKAGPLSGLFALVEPWVDTHGLWLDSVSKAERGFLLARGRAHSEAVKARAPAIDAGMDAQAFAREAVTSCLAQLLPNASAVAAGSTADEHIHQLRVGLRRLRTALRELAPFDCGLDPGWEAPLSAVFETLGRARDAQLLQSQTAAELRAAGAPALPVPASSRAPDLASEVQAARFQHALLAALAFAMDAAPSAGPAYDGLPLAALQARLDQLQRQLRRSAKHFIDLSADEQHHARKRLKRLRYLAEFIAPLFRNARVGDYFDHLRPAQDALGRHNDEAVALAAYRTATRAAEQAAGAWFAVGWLSARQACSARTAARALKKAGAARPFWHGKLRR